MTSVVLHTSAILPRIAAAYPLNGYPTAKAKAVATAKTANEKPGVDQTKAVVGTNVVSLQRSIPFCDGQVVFVDSRLLMGAFRCQYHQVRTANFSVI